MPCCIAIDILSPVRLINDAYALLESIMLRNSGNVVDDDNASSRFRIADSLLSTYRIANSVPFVFDLSVQSYSKLRKPEEAGKLVEQMISIGLKPYDETYNLVIVGYGKKGNLELGMRFYDEMMKVELVPSCSAFNLMVETLCAVGNVKQANHLLTLLIERGSSPDEFTYYYLIEGYRKEGHVQQSLKLYYEMEYRLLLLDYQS
ncbi:hypothetical protein Ancab_016455 [Ancistrocladus abbreviatus]